MLAQRAAEPVALEVGRPQLEDQRAELVERLAGRAPSASRAAPAAPSGSTPDERRRGLGGQDEAEELLAYGVVELEREPVSLREDRQLAALLVQARVRDRDRGVRGQQLDQLLVAVGEVGAPFFSVR